MKFKLKLKLPLDDSQASELYNFLADREADLNDTMREIYVKLSTELANTQ